MNGGRSKKRLTKLGNWGVIFTVTMPFFALFFSAVHYWYAADTQNFSAYVAGPGFEVETIAAAFAYGAAAFAILAVVGVIMIRIGREIYIAEEQDGAHLPHCGLRELCAAA